MEDITECEMLYRSFIELFWHLLRSLPQEAFSHSMLYFDGVKGLQCFHTIKAIKYNPVTSMFFFFGRLLHPQYVYQKGQLHLLSKKRNSAHDWVMGMANLWIGTTVAHKFAYYLHHATKKGMLTPLAKSG
jgi:hypothetical protein